MQLGAGFDIRDKDRPTLTSLEQRQSADAPIVYGIGADVRTLKAGGAEPHNITSMTWYFIDKKEYTENLRGIGQAYRDVIGRHFPAMAAVQVAGLVEDRAKIEIQATAVVPD